MDVACPVCGETLCDIIAARTRHAGEVRVLMLCLREHEFYIEVRQGGETGKEVTIRLTTDAELAAEDNERLMAHADQEFEP